MQRSGCVGTKRHGTVISAAERKQSQSETATRRILMMASSRATLAPPELHAPPRRQLRTLIPVLPSKSFGAEALAVSPSSTSTTPTPIRVHCHVNGTVRTVNCQRGLQTFSWLAHVCSSALAADLKCDASVFAVRSVSTLGGDLLLPFEPIHRFCRDLDSVLIVLERATLPTSLAFTEFPALALVTGGPAISTGVRSAAFIASPSRPSQLLSSASVFAPVPVITSPSAGGVPGMRSPLATDSAARSPGSSVFNFASPVHMHSGGGGLQSNHASSTAVDCPAPDDTSVSRINHIDITTSLHAHEGPTRSQSIWQLFAATPIERWIPVTLELDLDAPNTVCIETPRIYSSTSAHKPFFESLSALPNFMCAPLTQWSEFESSVI